MARRPLSAAPRCVSGGREAVRAVRSRGVSEEAGHEAADQHPVKPGLEGLGRRGGLHSNGVHRPHAYGAAPDGGAQSQASLHGPCASAGVRVPPVVPSVFFRVSVICWVGVFLLFFIYF